MLTKLAIPCSLAALLLIGFVRANPGDEGAINAYHERVARVINSIPVDINGWVGKQVPVPQSATNLLRPNAIIARNYTNDERGLSATLLVVQCRDTRDMAGHYPPQCYPASGWLEPDEDAVSMVEVEGQEMRRYRFHRVAGQAERSIIVYSLFVLPTGDLTVSMTDVRRLSADYGYRRYGAAQIQVLLDAGVDEGDQAWILDQMYQIAKPAIDAVLDRGDGQPGRERGDV